MTNSLFERRLSSRVELNRIVLVKNAAEVKKLVGVNYSMGGIAVFSPQPLSVGAEVDLLFWLTEPENQEIKVPARVLNSRKENNSFINSLQFIGQMAVN